MFQGSGDGLNDGDKGINVGITDDGPREDGGKDGYDDGLGDDRSDGLSVGLSVIGLPLGVFDVSKA